MSYKELRYEKGQYILEVATDITPYLKQNFIEKKEIGKGFSKRRGFRKIASIPIEALLSLPPEKAVAIMNDDKEMRKFLKEHPEFRCSEGGI